MKPWAVFVSGSRDLLHAHAPLIEDELRPLVWAKKYGVVIHGAGPARMAAIGCDQLAHRICARWEVREIACPALWEEQGPAAGPIRNRLCAEILAAHALAGYQLAFRAFSTGGAGTASAIRCVEAILQINFTIDFKKIDVSL